MNHVGKALISVGLEAEEQEIKEAVISNMQDWGKRYPNAGYEPGSGNGYDNE